MQVRVQYRRMHTVPEAYAPKVLENFDKVFEVMVTCPGISASSFCNLTFFVRKSSISLGISASP